jgi:GntR family transcriptional regulator, transcriptional repressor for pyruvate dehydrogenase complex
MRDAFAPVLKQSLSDRLAQRIRGLIQGGEYQEGDRLPAIMEMARRFGVGHPTIREALKKLEAMGVVEIRHGSGVYVIRSEEVLVLASPDYAGTFTKKLLLDLIRARMPLEMQSASDAVQNATPEHIAEMRRLLTEAGKTFEDKDVQHVANMGFHRQIALASGNTVLAQLIDVVIELFAKEQRMILGLFSRQRDHEEHLAILDAIEQRNQALAVERMKAHLAGVEDAVLRWDPDKHPII